MLISAPRFPNLKGTKINVVEHPKKNKMIRVILRRLSEFRGLEEVAFKCYDSQLEDAIFLGSDGESPFLQLTGKVAFFYEIY